MDLHRLTLRAIGPYADEYTIDFAALGASGVFLLEGPTGSGKSTIIDAIVFALYGGLAGSSSSDDRLHSHHASPAVEPFVELVFETASGIHRIRRTPAWERPKTRGVGTTRVNQAVTLVRLASPEAIAGEPLSSRGQEVGIEIRRIIGLTKEQFLQTIVLPQGEFARFLGATGEDRRLVLQSLFGTEIYDHTTDELATRRRLAHASVKAAEQAVSEALANLRGAAGDDELGGEQAASAVAAFASESDGAAAARDEARSVRDTAEAHRLAQRRLVEALARRELLLERRRAAEAARSSIDGRRARLQRGRRALTVEGPARALARANEALEKARERLERAESENPALAAVPVADLVGRRDRSVALVESLRALADLESALETRRADYDRGLADHEVLEAAIASDEAVLAERALGRAERASGIDPDELVAERLVAAQNAEREASTDLDAVRRLDTLRSASAEATRRVAAALAAAHQAIDAETALRRRRITGMAGELALALVDGEPCAVCGATSHPAPAPLIDDHPSIDDVERAETRRAIAERDLAEARDEASSVAGRTDAALEVVRAAARRRGPGQNDDAEATVGVAAQRLDAARRAVVAAESAASQASRRATELAAFDATTARLSDELQRSRILFASEGSRLDGVRRAIEESTATITAALDGQAERVTVSDLAAAARRDVQSLSAMIEAVTVHDRARDDHRDRAADLAAAVAEAGFESPEAAAVAVLDPADHRADESAVAQHEREIAVVAEGLAAPDLRDLTGDESVDLESATVASAAAEVAYAGLADRAAVALDRADRSERALRAYEAALVAERAVGAETRAVVRMADVTAASGPENRTGVTLGTYVLLRRFDDVLAAANARLQVMSSGRYQLEAADRETSSRARKTGLALAIRDNATGTTRDPRSFSGGETFYASLSLALGLADVVQAEAGGIDLGTLFVDEGFGTLDPETLDSVLSELGRLSASGRVVGIVSHVEDLKQRIADRIEVRRRPDGSSVLTSTAGA